MGLMKILNYCGAEILAHTKEIGMKFPFQKSVWLPIMVNGILLLRIDGNFIV